MGEVYSKMPGYYRRLLDFPPLLCYNYPRWSNWYVVYTTCRSHHDILYAGVSSGTDGRSSLSVALSHHCRATCSKGETGNHREMIPHKTQRGSSASGE